jgi:hypothetical protein
LESLTVKFQAEQAMQESSPVAVAIEPTLNGGADVSPLPAFETAIRKAGFDCR